MKIQPKKKELTQKSSNFRQPKNLHIQKAEKMRMADSLTSVKEDSIKIFYEKIKPLKPETIDIASIIADYHGSDSRQKTRKVNIQNKKSHRKNEQKKQIKEQTHFGKKLIPYFMSFCIQFKQALRQKFDGKIDELSLYRKSMMTPLFNCLIYGYQEIKEQYKNDPQSEKTIQSIRKQDLTSLILKKVFLIDQEMTKRLNFDKEKPTLKLKAQWKFILGLFKENSNSKLREAILTGQILPLQLAYACQNQLIQYLPQDRQKQVQAIIKNTLIDVMPWEKSTQREEGDDDYETDSQVTTMTNEKSSQIPKLKSQEKGKKRKSDQKARTISLQSDEMQESLSVKKKRKT